MKSGVYAAFRGKGMAVSLTDGVAVTTSANRGGLDPKQIFGEAKDYGLLFFPSSQYLLQLPQTAPFAGEAVTVFGQGNGGALRSLDGAVIDGVPALSFQCAVCKPSETFAVAFDSAAGTGFLGAPVLDAKSGKLVGIVFAVASDKKRPRFLAYRLSFVRGELNKIISATPGDPD